MTESRTMVSGVGLIILAIAAVSCGAPESPQQTADAAASTETSPANRVEAELAADLERLANRLIARASFPASCC
jgi:hypothetical protein